MAGELSQFWCAVPNSFSTLSADVLASGMKMETHRASTAVAAEGATSSFSGCYANHADSNENNAAHSGNIRLARCTNPSTASKDAVLMLSNQDGRQAPAGRPDSVLPDTDPADSMECSGEFDPTSSTITYAIQLLGGSRASSYSTQMAWADEDELTVEQAYAAAGGRASALPAAGNSYSSSTPRASTAARICPPAPVRRRPTIRLVPAAELGMFVNAQ